MERASARKKKTALVTGAAGFIGFHTTERLLKDGWRVVGVDALTDYYDPRLKRKRLALLKNYPHFSFRKLDLANYSTFEKLVRQVRPDEIIHLAAQPGVRYSLGNPWSYERSNDLGTLNVFEAAKRLSLGRVVYASSSSVYGVKVGAPMKESDDVDHPLSLYAATKRANELLAHTYNHLYGMEMIGLRFFTVYGEWNRPDLAIFKFTQSILAGEPIDVYNRGRMKRSFTHVADIVEGIMGTIRRVPRGRYEFYNLGGAKSVPLMNFIELIESAAGKKARKRLLPMQAGDVPETVADCKKAARALGYAARIPVEKGIEEFVAWFRKNERFLRTLTPPRQ